TVFSFSFTTCTSLFFSASFFDSCPSSDPCAPSPHLAHTVKEQPGHSKAIGFECREYTCIIVGPARSCQGML
ncbi:hypothetical protein BDN70DRAFT_871267, partial [Pholiota conissans]